MAASLQLDCQELSWARTSEMLPSATELMLVVECEELNQELEGHLLAFQEDSRRILDADTYEVPEGFAVQTTPFWKRIARAVFGLVVQPFRCLI